MNKHFKSMVKAMRILSVIYGFERTEQRIYASFYLYKYINNREADHRHTKPKQSITLLGFQLTLLALSEIT